MSQTLLLYKFSNYSVNGTLLASTHLYIKKKTYPNDYETIKIVLVYYSWERIILVLIKIFIVFYSKYFIVTSVLYVKCFHIIRKFKYQL